VAVTAKQVISTGTCRRLPELRETGFAVQKSARTPGAAVSAPSVPDEKPRKIEGTARWHVNQKRSQRFVRPSVSSWRERINLIEIQNFLNSARQESAITGS